MVTATRSHIKQRGNKRREPVGKRKPGHVPVSEIFPIAIIDIRPAVINDTIYGAIDPNDPQLDDLASLLKTQGQLEPVVLTLDDVLLSGHRRLAAGKRLRWETLKARRHPIRSTDAGFEQVLVSYNAQRVKTPDVQIREQLVLADPEDTYQALLSERAEASAVKADTLVLGDRQRRSKISQAKGQFLDAAKRVVSELKAYWPLSDRRIHYALLNNPPLIHSSKPASLYQNNKESYKSLCDLLTRARIEGYIPFDAIGDETRPMVIWDTHPHVAPFFRREVDRFCKNYWRDLMQGQPNHVEIVGEKLTVEGIVRPVASKYCIPYTIGRGYASLPPRKEMDDRYRKSGKDKLVILFLGDHDPEGWNITETFAMSMRDDFDVRKIVPVKVALKPEQVQQLGLPPNTAAKKRAAVTKNSPSGSDRRPTSSKQCLPRPSPRGLTRRCDPSSTLAASTPRSRLRNGTLQNSRLKRQAVSYLRSLALDMDYED